MGLGDIYQREGDEEKALTFFEKLIGKSGGSVMALTSAANIYRGQRQYQKAMKYYGRVLEINPHNSHAWHGKADCFRGIKDYSSAIKAWKTALKYGMAPRIVMTRIGDTYLILKDLEQAEINYKKALDIGYDKYAYLGMARIYLNRGLTDKAFEVLSMLVEKEPDDSRLAAEFKRLEKSVQVGRKTTR